MATNDEPRIQLGKYENGVLEIREGFKKLDDESLEGYENVRKVIFPASLKQLDDDVFSDTKELEELDFSRVTKLKEIPGDLVSCKTKITKFVIPQGVKEVGDGFLSEAKKGTKIFVPASVKKMGYINGNDNNDLDVYLYTSDIDVDDFETDVNTLYVLPKDYADYAEKLTDCESEAKLREIPEELLNLYSDTVSTTAPAAQPIPASKPASAAVMSAPTPPPAPAAPKVDNQPAAPVASSAPQNVSKQQTTNTKNMANNLIPQELDALIQQYLTDGVLTDKERQVILNKAEKLGLDRDEIDLYLDAEVQKIDQATDAAARRQKGKTCPYCGGSVPQLTDKCPHCGKDITPEASQELQEIFDNLEEALVDFKSGKDIAKSKATVERYMRKAKMYYGNNPKIQRLLEEVELESEKAEKIAKANARKNAFVKILTYNWKITAAVFLVLVVGLIWGINRVISGPDLTSDATACTKAIREALNNNDIETAVALWKGFDRWNNKGLGYSEDDIARACIKSGDIDKALGVTGKRDPANAFDDDKPIFAEIETAYLERGEYDKAIGVWDRSGWCAKDNYRILCICIDKMRSEKSSTEIKNFINRYMSLFYEEDQNKYKAKLYEYAGMK